MANKKKLGRVVRLTPDLETIVFTEQRSGESIADTIRRLFGITGDVRYVLPSDIHETVEDARGVAVLRAVKTKSKRTEKPTAVRVKE